MDLEMETLAALCRRLENGNLRYNLATSIYEPYIPPSQSHIQKFLSLNLTQMGRIGKASIAL